MKIYVLLENTSCCDDLTAEHGLSLYLETDTHKILFDMGPSSAFAENAEKMGVRLADVDLAVLSHGHYDHGGGISTFLELNQKAPLYLSQYAFGDYWRGSEKYIGLEQELRGNSRLKVVGDELRLDEGLTLYSCNDMQKKVPVDHYGLTRREGEEYHPDPFLHEQYLLIEENGKRILISGCSHKGIINLVSWFKPDILIGGFHYMKLDASGDGAEILKHSAETLLESPTMYYTGHCTGSEPFTVLKQYMGDRLEAISTGMVIEL